MIIIPAFLNFILWIVYLSGTMLCTALVLPSLGGGWQELNFMGKTTCIFTGTCAIIAASVLVATTTLPL